MDLKDVQYVLGNAKQRSEKSAKLNGSSDYKQHQLLDHRTQEETSSFE